MLKFWLKQANIRANVTTRKMINDAQKQTSQNTIIIATTIPPAAPHLLHLQFVQLGRERNKITYKLLALLPQIYQQKIFETEGYGTIYEYAGKLAGLSHSIVEKALKLEDKLKDKPHLQRAIETQGIHKVALVAKIATPQTDLFFADKVENMSKSALIELSKEMRGKVVTENENNSQMFANQHIEVVYTKPPMKIDLDDEMKFLFLKLKKEMKEQRLSNKEFLRRLLKKMVDTSQMMHKPQKSASASQSAPNFPGKKIAKNIKILSNHNDTRKQTDRVARYICVVIKRAALEITNGRCAHEGCNKPYEILHHVERFAAGGSHESIIPLCKEHHEFAHNGLLKEDGAGRGVVGRGGRSEKVGSIGVGSDGVNRGGRSEKAGSLGGGEPSRGSDSEIIDLLYKKYRQAAIA